MDTLIITINFVILGLIISLPLLIIIRLKKRNTKKIVIKYFFIGLFLMSLLMLIFAAWDYVSSMLLLEHYGYNFISENYDKVLPVDRERVDNLVTSLMGIGWPLKAIFGFIITIPYLIFVYFSKLLIDRVMANKSEA